MTIQYINMNVFMHNLFCSRARGHDMLLLMMSEWFNVHALTSSIDWSSTLMRSGPSTLFKSNNLFTHYISTSS